MKVITKIEPVAARAAVSKTRVFNDIPLLNEPWKWTSQSIWYENRGISGTRNRTSFILLCMAFM